MLTEDEKTAILESAETVKEAGYGSVLVLVKDGMIWDVEEMIRYRIKEVE